MSTKEEIIVYYKEEIVTYYMKFQQNHRAPAKELCKQKTKQLITTLS